MCSIEEAWAGQTFGGKPVTSQGDLHKAYMSLPDDLMTNNNQFSMKTSNEPQPRSLSRGINSKYSREPRVPNINRNSDNANINFSSTMPPIDNYGGLNPRPDYMEIYDKSAPMPMMTGEKFNDIENAFNVSSTVNSFMQRGMSNTNTNTYTNDELLNEDTSEERNIINIKNNNKQNNKQNKNEFLNIKTSSKYNSSDRMNKYSESSESSDDTYSNEQVLIILQQVISKLNKMEQTINNINHFNNQNNNQSRNMYDIILYIIIGMILAFMLFSICSSIKHIK